MNGLNIEHLCMCLCVLQASQVVSNRLSGVAKAAVFPLFESAGRLHLALTGE
jgi:hypothetical protein